MGLLRVRRGGRLPARNARPHRRDLARHVDHVLGKSAQRARGRSDRRRHLQQQPHFHHTWTLITSICDGYDCRDNPDDLAYDWPVVVTMATADGENLLASAKQQPITVSAYLDDYGNLSGTSMATPHVTGVAALAWSLAPTATARQVAAALRSSAVDLGPPGVDDRFGFGMVDALAAARWLAPSAFGLPPRPDLRTHATH